MAITSPCMERFSRPTVEVPRIYYCKRPHFVLNSVHRSLQREHWGLVFFFAGRKCGQSQLSPRPAPPHPAPYHHLRWQDQAEGMNEQGEIQQVEDLMLMEALRQSVLDEQARREQ